MTPSEALDLVALVCERWPSLRLDREQMRRYAEDIADLDGREARAAVDVLHRKGGEFAPTAGAVRFRVAALQLDAPEWVDVKRQLIERHVMIQHWTPPEWECPDGRCDGSGWIDEGGDAAECSCYQARADHRRLAETLHPLVREFIRDRYASWAEVEQVGQATGRDSTTLEAQMRTKWEAFAGRAIESRAIATLPDGAGLLRIDQAREEDARREPTHRPALKPFDPLAALGMPQRADASPVDLRESEG